MDTITQSTLDQTVLAISALRDSVFANKLPYITKVFEQKEFPIAHGRKVIAMCMTEELGGNTERQKFLRLVFGVEKSADLNLQTLSGLWHWLKPFLEDGKWHANEDAGSTMRKVIREDLDGVWTKDDGQPTLAIY